MQKQLIKLPVQVQNKLQAWITMIAMHGLEEVRRRPGFHDEPLAGRRKHQRSVRLNRQWRAIYAIEGGKVKVALVVEITPHAY